MPFMKKHKNIKKEKLFEKAYEFNREFYDDTIKKLEI